MIWRSYYIRSVSFAAAIIVLLAYQSASAESIVVSYLQRPPYYFKKNTQDKGILVDITRAVFERAGLEHSFVVLPPKRIMLQLRRADSSHCSIGWFKTPQRELFSKFTLPIYQNKSLVVLFNKSSKPVISSYKTVAQLVKDPTLTMGRVAAFSYGDYIDDLLDKHKPQTLEVTGKQGQLVRLLSIGRISYLFISPVEVPTIIASAGFSTHKLETHILSDIPKGNKRYLMCSTATSDQSINRLNLAIQEVIDPSIWYQ